jgi:hypothetical protein
MKVLAKSAPVAAAVTFIALAANRRKPRALGIVGEMRSRRRSRQAVTCSQAAGKEALGKVIECEFGATPATFAAQKVGPFLAVSATVECWIGVTSEGGRRIVRVAGRLKVAHVPELLAACADSPALELHALELHLSDLISADMAGIEALRRMRMKGAVLVDTPGYINLKISSAG